MECTKYQLKISAEAYFFSLRTASIFELVTAKKIEMLISTAKKIEMLISTAKKVEMLIRRKCRLSGVLLIVTIIGH